MLKIKSAAMKTLILLLMLSLNCIILDSIVYGQNRSVSGGLGLSDAQWNELFGSPIPVARDAWSYQGGHYYTRSWARQDAPSGRHVTGYSPDDYYVKYIEIVWGRNKAASPDKARLAVRERLPADSGVIAKYRRAGSKAVEYYSSHFLASRLSPGMAGDSFCVTPWGYGVGKFKVEYYFVRGRVVRVVIDVGEPHEVSLDICRGKEAVYTIHFYNQGKQRFGECSSHGVNVEMSVETRAVLACLTPMRAVCYFTASLCQAH